MACVDFIVGGFTQAQPGVYRTTFSADERYLTVEVLDDDLAHFEISTTPPGSEAYLDITDGRQDGLPGHRRSNSPAKTIATPDMHGCILTPPACA